MGIRWHHHQTPSYAGTQMHDYDENQIAQTPSSNTVILGGAPVYVLGLLPLWP